VFLKKLIPQAIESISTINAWLAQQNTEEIMATPWAKSIMDWMQENLTFIAFTQAEIQDSLLGISKAASQYLIRGMGAALQNTLTFTLHFLLVLLVMFFMLIDGPRLLARLQYLSPLRRRQNEAIVTNLRRVARAVLVGGLLTAVLQGIVGGIGMAVVGMPALFCGALMAVTALVPLLGTSLVWVPVTIWLLIIGQTWQAVFVVGWCAILVTNIDTVLRPIFMRNSAGLSTFFVFMSIIGGLHVFGMLGIFYGPLILGFAVVMLSLYGEEYHDLLASKMRASSLAGTATQQARHSVGVAGSHGQKSPRTARYIVARRKNK
jgi:predicted PurR-regulated permease PerM